MRISEMNMPVGSVNGVGPAMTKQLSRLNVFTVGDLLQYFPRKYEDRTKRIPIRDYATTPITKVHTIAQIVGRDWFGYGRMKTLKLVIDDGTARAELICFNRAFLENAFPVGAIASVTGKFEVKYNSLQSTSFEIKKITDSGMLCDFANELPPDSKVYPIYPLTEGLTQKVLHKVIMNAIAQYGKGINDEVPPNLMQKRNIMHKKDAIEKIHNPATVKDAENARKSLSYEELFNFQKMILERAIRHRGTLGNTNLLALETMTLMEENSTKTMQLSVNENSNNIGTPTNGRNINLNTEIDAKKDTNPNKKFEYGQSSDDIKSHFITSLSPLQKSLLNALPFPLTADQMTVITEMNAEIDRGYSERNTILIKETLRQAQGDNVSGRGDNVSSQGDKKNVILSERSEAKNLTENSPFACAQSDNPTVIPSIVEESHCYTSSEKNPFTMARLLQGDVGSGKTLVALFMCLRIKNYEGQSALMAPTEILAKQHAETAARLLSPLGLNVAFLSGNVKTAGRTQILKALKNGEIDLIVGTHALFSSDVAYKDLQLAVIDEQHRFGVMQRESIVAKGRKSIFENVNQNSNNNKKNTWKNDENTPPRIITFEPHLLMMSATPIPQTLALTVFGDLDVSTIRTKPVGRKEIQTYLVKEGNERNAYEAVRKELASGRQAYFVYPAIGDADDADAFQLMGNGKENARGLKSATTAFENLVKNVYPEYKCALLHSKIPEEEQERILRDFHKGEIQILAATTVIEVGVDVPNATCIVIEGADYFGLSQLHQLRGRVGRSDLQSFCFLIYSARITETGIERMKALKTSTDGFYLSEQDLKIRGPGEINGTIQAGALEFGVADIVRDKEILMIARQDAIEILTT